MNDARIELQNDSHWLLIERIASSESFQKSERLRDLLRYLAEKTLLGATQELSEHQIGVGVFGKREDYKIVEDSSVRVHVRQLRLKLHEYFDGEGREERLVVEIPKGAYSVVFRAVEKGDTEPSAPSNGRPSLQILPWSLAVLFLATTLTAWFHRPATPPSAVPPWPLALLFDQQGHPVQIIVADAAYGIKRLLNGRPSTLDQYLSPAFWNDTSPSNGLTNDQKSSLNSYLSRSLLTSYADLIVVDLLKGLAADSQDRFIIRAARNLHPRDLEEDSFIFVGSPASNPWVSSFQNQLSFQEFDNVVNTDTKCFQNAHPAPGEQPRYCAQNAAGRSGETYATISLLPMPSGPGRALILQGLHQEATEAAGDFLADASKRNELQRALGISSTSGQPVYFEALIRIQAIAGAPSTTSIVVAHVLHP